MERTLPNISVKTKINVSLTAKQKTLHIISTTFTSALQSHSPFITSEIM